VGSSKRHERPPPAQSGGQREGAETVLKGHEHSNVHLRLALACEGGGGDADGCVQGA
jgi:hypothetical protein